MGSMWAAWVAPGSQPCSPPEVLVFGQGGTAPQAPPYFNPLLCFLFVTGQSLIGMSAAKSLATWGSAWALFRPLDLFVFDLEI